MTQEEKDFIDKILDDEKLKRMWYGEYVDWDKVRETALYFYKLGTKNDTRRKTAFAERP